MTRRLADRHPHRLLRARPAPHRLPHGLDIALPALRAVPDEAHERALHALAEENAVLARELGRVQARCTRWRDDCIAHAARLEAQLMQARGALILKETLLAIAREAPAAPAPPARRVLCVGGRARQVPVYRELVERGGGEFVHVEGANVDCLPELAQALAGADMVILQARYVCRGACQAVESHCARTGVRRIHLDKPCALGFAQALAQGADEANV